MKAKNKMSLISVINKTGNFLMVPTVLGAAYMIGSVFYYHSKGQEIAPNIERYLLETKPGLTKNIEGRFSVSIPDFRFEFKQSFPIHYLGTSPSMKVEDGKIIVNLQRAISFNKYDRNDGHWFWWNFMPRSVNDATAHEIGHIYALKIEKELQEQGAYHKSHIPPLIHFEKLILPHRLIKEGIAEYIKKELPGRLPAADIAWPTKKEQFFFNSLVASSELNYFFAYHLVKPILDELGLKKGIEAIYKNPIVFDSELLKPKLYQKRIVKAAN